jgi:xanthine/uracil/vitamin C permease (AzgA family)
VLERIFRLRANNTSVRTEVIAGVTTFLLQTGDFLIRTRYRALGYPFQQEPVTSTSIVQALIVAHTITRETQRLRVHVAGYNY